MRAEDTEPDAITEGPSRLQLKFQSFLWRLFWNHIDNKNTCCVNLSQCETVTEIWNNFLHPKGNPIIFDIHIKGRRSSQEVLQISACEGLVRIEYNQRSKLFVPTLSQFQNPFITKQYSLEEQLCHSYWLVSLPRGVGAVEVVLREVAGLMECGVLKTATGQALVGIQHIVLSHVVWTVRNGLGCLLHAS